MPSLLRRFPKAARAKARKENKPTTTTEKKPNRFCNSSKSLPNYTAGTTLLTGQRGENRGQGRRLHRSSVAGRQPRHGSTKAPQRAAVGPRHRCTPCGMGKAHSCGPEQRGAAGNFQQLGNKIDSKWGKPHLLSNSDGPLPPPGG